PCTMGHSQACDTPERWEDAVRLVKNHGLLSFPLWIDAICINQTDVVEKSHQIGLMARIYSQSTIMLMWLGPEDATSSAALALTKEMLESST
ncbi:heterokaryon incompatibility, partial [Staphylotrichum tortipilum]